MAILTVINMEGELAEYDLLRLGTDRIVIGRDMQTSQILLLDPIVSSRQFELIHDGFGRFEFADCSSANGTMLERDGRRYLSTSPSDRVLLEDGDILRIGDPDNPRRQVLLQYSQMGRQGQWTQYAIASKPVWAGSAQDCLISLPQPGIPDQAVRMEKKDAHSVSLLISPAAQSARINGKPVAGRALLYEKDVLSLGSFQILYSGGSLFYPKKQKGVRLQACRVTKKVPSSSRNPFAPKDKTILDDVSLTIEPSQFVAIIGGSGAGKTTLMNALSAFDPDFAGAVLFDGMDLRQNFDQLKSQIGYVPQQDILYEELPLDQMLQSAARLRMPKGTGEKAIARRVMEVLEMVDLSGHSKTLISKLSGGQKKRASIAVELLSDPRLFFLDEPTSGLDPGTEKALMLTLNRLAREQDKTIVMVTHNIGSLEKCDQIIMMEPGGRLAFMGSAAMAKSEFKTSRLDDIYQILAEDTQGEQARKWRQAHPFRKPAPARKKPPAKTKDTFLRQFAVMLRRYFTLLFRRSSFLALLLVQPVIIAALLAIVSGDDTFTVYEDTKSMMFSLACAGIWLGLFDTIQDICRERTIIKREYMNKLKLSSYLLAKLAVFACVGLVQALLLCSVYLGIVGHETEGIIGLGGLPEMSLVMFMTILVSQALGLLVSAVSPTADKAMICAPFILIVQLLFSGILFRLKGFGEFISWFTISKWSVEGLGSVADLNSLSSRMEIDYPGLIEGGREAEEIFKSSPDHLLLVLSILLLFTALYMIICGILLTRIKKDHR